MCTRCHTHFIRSFMFSCHFNVVMQYVKRLFKLGDFIIVCFHVQDQLEMMSMEKACRSSVVPSNCLREFNTPAVTTPSKVSSTTKLTLTPGRITTATHLTLTPANMASFTATPMKPPRRNGVSATPTPNSQVRRTSTRLNLKSPNMKSPSTGNSARLTTPRSRLPIVF